jgi:hypothetical protein
VISAAAYSWRSSDSGGGQPSAVEGGTRDESGGSLSEQERRKDVKVGGSTRKKAWRTKQRRVEG